MCFYVQTDFGFYIFFYLGYMLMNAKPQTHAKMADNARTQLEAMNTNASLDLQAEIAKHVGYRS